MATRIVIVGGGFGGTAVAARLERIFRRRRDVEIVLFDRENFSVFTPLLPEVPSGALEAKHIVSPLRARLRRTSVRQAEVRAIDTERRLVVAGHCPTCAEYVVEYDYLVLALGSVTNFFGLPGVAERARTLKSLADGANLHHEVIGRFEHADLDPDPAVRRRLLTFVVAGGGFAGVETAAELNDFVRAARRYYPGIARDDVRVVLVHSGDRVLPEVSTSLSAYALGKLSSRGVEIRLGTRILGCDGARIRLSAGGDIDGDMLIWTAGVSPHPLLATLGLPRETNGRLAVDEHLRVRGRPGVFALGDCAAVRDPVTGALYPPTAQYAIRQGRVVADNVGAAVTGQPPRAFRYRPLGMLASLGRRSAVAEIVGVRFSGFVAWWLWRTIYLMKLPGVERKVRVMLDWTLDLFFTRDIVYLRGLAHVAAAPLAAAPRERTPA
ncbi:MAG TPA: NAD(P)/FAD-dependent oxidoreductase [Terriglobales bacterium]|nr:NAD(P)/FAD-dependent oxidoreductase [Terriglobales bacterium]